MNNQNQPNKQPQQPQEPQNMSPAEQYRNEIYNEKKDELNKELQKYEQYCVRSKDLEHILSLHNFFLGDSFKEVKAIYKKYMNRVESSLDERAKEILEDTFDLMFYKHPLDFYAQFAVRVNITVPEENMKDKDVFAVHSLTVIYKGEEKDEVVLQPAQTEQLVQELNKKADTVEDLQELVLANEVFVDMLKNIIYNTLANPKITYNTIFFNQSEKSPNYLNAADFKKVANKNFDSFVKEIPDFLVNTTLIQQPKGFIQE